jgi:hypothetical protein
MIKVKLIFSLIFFLAVHQVGFSVNLMELSLPVQSDDETELSFEANDSLPGIWGDVPVGKVSVGFCISVKDLFAGNNNSKNIQSGLFFSAAKTKLDFFIARSSVFTRYSAVYIPIYLHTASFLL